ncbi:MAG: hypothetical protein ACREFO_04530 [Acetobacteraceae bacterium]
MAYRAGKLRPACKPVFGVFAALTGFWRAMITEGAKASTADGDFFAVAPSF